MAEIEKFPAAPRSNARPMDERGYFNPEWYKFLTTKTPPVADVTTANATDLSSAIALVNANKAKINELLQALRKAGVVEN